MKNELKRIFKSKLLTATLVAVVILPLIYGILYLWAFWDPYGKMENLPVAIVNEDKCAYKSDKSDKEQYCFGQELMDKLKEEKDMNWQFVDNETAEKGLVDKTYYTMATIPKDFSENILSVDSDNPQQAQIEFKSREASSFMASKFTDTAFDKIKAALNEKISKEYFDNIFSETRDSVKDLKKAADGASDLADGLLEAKDGSNDLYDGIDKANSGAYDLKNGLNTLHNGSETLATGASNALSGVNQLSTGTNNLSAGQSAVISAINAYISLHPEASTSAELQTALVAATQVNGGINQLKTGLSSLSVGVSNIATGSASLRDGLSSAVDGGATLMDGLAEIKDGEKELGDGLADAYDGSVELRDKLSESVDKNIDKTDEVKNAVQATVMSAPVDIHDVSIDIVNNNGTGFAPYFIPLALWIGGLATFFLIELTFKSKNIVKEFMPKLWLSLIVGTFQVITLDFVLIYFLGLQINYFWQFIGFTMLLAWCFTLIQMILVLVFEMAGRFIGVVLLMLQLTSCAGTYPLETAPEFFQKVSPYLPFTYAVSGLRELVSGSNFNLVIFDSQIILYIILFVLVLIFTYLLKPVKLLLVKVKNPCCLKTKKKK
ncbi:MAG: YhgE/Pip domain-containing protein [Candidatus Shapirobacteria bacterium]|nr:YhgE/Pip domain-containing protein [Candidatus Shapirobacteria bacterium]MDD3003198.1 YhgE/Pip domain-containing protein [Candidatus Shapirobacteria bacterium]MDD4383162.1 YhgE/Pip domain-containing protein [Candidatus Shapirobacteria bacterium]